MEISAYVMRSDGTIHDLPMLEELTTTLQSLRQGAAQREESVEGETIWELVQVLKQAMALQAQQAGG